MTLTFTKYIAFTVITAVHRTEHLLARGTIETQLVISLTGRVYFLGRIHRLSTSCALIRLACRNHHRPGYTRHTKSLLVITRRIDMRRRGRFSVYHATVAARY